MTVLCLIETEAGGGAADASMRALVVARGLADSAGEDLAAVWVGPAEAIDPAGLVSAGVSSAWAIGSAGMSGYAPLAWARALSGLAADLPGLPGGVGPERGPVSAVVAAATDHGNEVFAHLGAITGLPMAASCVSAARTSPTECSLVRQRWAGSLLEDAVLETPLALLTVAADAIPADAVAADPASAAAVGLRVEHYEPLLADGDLLCWPPNRPNGARGCRWPVHGSWSAAAAASAGPRGSPCSRSSPGCSARPSVSLGW